MLSVQHVHFAKWRSLGLTQQGSEHFTGCVGGQVDGQLLSRGGTAALLQTQLPSFTMQ